MHPLPKRLFKPGGDVGISVSEYEHPHPRAAHKAEFRPVGGAVAVGNGIPGKERNAGRGKLTCYPVIHLVSCLDVVIAHNYGVIPKIRHQSREKVRSGCLYVIIIVSGVVALEAVAGIDEKYICGSIHPAYAIKDRLKRHQARPCRFSRYVRSVKPGTVNVASGKDVEFVRAVSGVA